MNKIPKIIPVRKLPETFSNTLSSMSWLAKLTAKVNEIIAALDGSGVTSGTWRFSYDESTKTLTIEREEF